jgi:hypothetical protein|uniref:Methyltransferase n=1 Tax=viral metagenome TaxID=1070528 RepID=A0A6C0J1B8_9ZZZZ
MTKDLPGDIVECGVFKGSGIFTWYKLIELYAPFEIKKVIGFDYFDQEFVESLSEKDRDGMKQVFSRCQATKNEISPVFKEYMYEEFKKILKYFTLTKYL